jgi:hypothetical protein
LCEKQNHDELDARLAEMCGHSPPTEEAYYFKFENEYIQETLSKQQQQE